jgi:hypothetical protein
MSCRTHSLCIGASIARGNSTRRGPASLRSRSKTQRRRLGPDRTTRLRTATESRNRGHQQRTRTCRPHCRSAVACPHRSCSSRVPPNLASSSSQALTTTRPAWGRLRRDSPRRPRRAHRHHRPRSNSRRSRRKRMPRGHDGRRLRDPSRGSYGTWGENVPESKSGSDRHCRRRERQRSVDEIRRRRQRLDRRRRQRLDRHSRRASGDRFVSDRARLPPPVR